MRARSPVWNQRLRKAAIVASGRRQYSRSMIPGARGRTWISPTSPTSTLTVLLVGEADLEGRRGAADRALAADLRVFCVAMPISVIP